MPRLGFEPMIPVFEQAKTVLSLDRAATVIGNRLMIVREIIIIMALQPFVGLGRFFSFLFFYIVGRTPWTATRFVDHFTTRLGTTSNYSATANLHTLQITTR
jgi:hypothetical protein